jgi:acetate kinase
MKKFLIVNNGSASKKYAVYADGQQIYFAHLEIEDGDSIVTEYINGEAIKSSITREEFDASLEFALKKMSERGITEKAEISAVGVRTVAPGVYFWNHREINEEYIQKMEEAKEKVPLHMTPILLAVKNLVESFKGVAPVYGISDSAFHSTLPEVAKIYGLPTEMAKQHEIYRFGYHGISVQSIVNKSAEFFGAVPSRMIVCHLGGGVSVTAVKDGQSLETSMGFTPLEGMLMATRVGDIDPGAVLYLLEMTGQTPAEMRKYFNKECGLLGVSNGLSDDVRDLIKGDEVGNHEAKLALDLFAYRVKKTIGAYMAVLGGLDALVFTGTIGERSFIMRHRICEGLADLGVELDLVKNDATVYKDEIISTVNSKIKIATLKTEEMNQIAREVGKLNN